MKPPYRHAIVVGASAGIGAELASQLAKEGVRVAIVARREDRLKAVQAPYPERVFTFRHDVTHYDEVPHLFEEIVKTLGGLDLIIYCAGAMPAVGPTEFDFNKDREMVETNLLGAIAWLNMAAVRFQNVGAGVIVGIGSVAGDRGRCGQPVYNASKAALATYLEALRNRLSRHGVTVVTIKPGPVDTEMTKALGLKGAMSANEAAERILARSHRNGEHYLKSVHRLIFYVIKRVPSPIFRKLKI